VALTLTNTYSNSASPYSFYQFILGYNTITNCIVTFNSNTIVVTYTGIADASTQLKVGKYNAGAMTHFGLINTASSSTITIQTTPITYTTVFY
jgi:hypothetical protein